MPDSHLGPGHINWRSADDPVHGEDIGGLAIGTVAILVHRIAGGVEHIRAHFERVGANRRERRENNGEFRVATTGDSHHRGDGNRPGGAGQGQVGGGEAGGVDRFGKSQCGTGGQPARLGELPDSHLGPGHINGRSD